jgi:hypothetical protein
VIKIWHKNRFFIPLSSILFHFIPQKLSTKRLFQLIIKAINLVPPYLSFFVALFFGAACAGALHGLRLRGGLAKMLGQERPGCLQAST